VVAAGGSEVEDHGRIVADRREPLMRMVKQSPNSNECGACVVAMLTGCTKEEVLADACDPEKPDYFWHNYMAGLGFELIDARNLPGFDKTLAWTDMVNGHLNLPLASRYYCSIGSPAGVHAVAVDEEGHVLDPSTAAPMQGTCTLVEYLRANYAKFGAVRISCCYRVRKVTGS